MLDENQGIQIYVSGEARFEETYLGQRGFSSMHNSSQQYLREIARLQEGETLYGPDFDLDSRVHSLWPLGRVVEKTINLEDNAIIFKTPKVYRMAVIFEIGIDLKALLTETNPSGPFPKA